MITFSGSEHSPVVVGLCAVLRYKLCSKEPLTRGGEIALRVNPTEQPIIAANQQCFLMYDVLENKALKVVC